MSIDPEASGPTKAPTPVVLLVVIGAASLVGFAAIGWALRSLRESRAPHDAPRSAPPMTRGRLVFQVHCARCHGPEGHGDGPDAAALRPPPRDLAAPAWRSSATREAVRRAVVEGVPKAMMPAFGASLAARELEAVVDHVLNLAPAATDSSAGARDLLIEAGFTPTPGNPAAPTFEARGVDGKPVALGGHRGKLVLVVFWGVGCAPCLKELPDLARLAARFQRGGLSVLPVCADETDPNLVRDVAEAHAPGLPVVLDPAGAARRSYDVQSLPSAALVDSSGRLLGWSQGAMNWSAPAMERLIGACLAHP